MGFENEWTKRIDELQEEICNLVYEARENDAHIEVLRTANNQKDEMIAAMTDDLVNEKKQVLRWSQSIHALLIERDRLHYRLLSLTDDPVNEREGGEKGG